MKKSRNGMRITGLLLTMVMLVALLGALSLTVSAAAAEDISVTIDTGASITLRDNDADGYYDIGTADELYAFAAAVNGGSYSINGELTANIVVNEGVLDEMAKAEPDTARFREWMPIGYYYILDDVEYDVYFLGNFDGNGKTVNGLYVNDTDKYSVGLFGQIGEGATVETVGVIDSYFCGNEFIGGVVGFNEFGTVTNCYNMGNVSGKLNVGGVIGANNYGNVTNCYNTGVVNGTEWIGGAVGYNYGTVEKCYNIGDVSGMSKVGGVLGGNDKLVTSCYYLAGTANGGIDSADISGQAEVKDDTWFAEYPICRVVGFGHEWADGSCTACGYVCIHDGEVTPATCQKQAVCETCGESYGELAEDNHNFDEFNTCVCGVKNFHIYGQQLNVGGDLSMKYYVTALGDGVSTETLTMEFLFLGKKTEVSGVYDSETRMYVFTLDGINPQCMGDEIDAYLLLDGEEKANKLDYTVEENLLALRKEYEEDEALVTLVNDILAYGTAASEYKNHNSMTDVYVGSDREIRETEWPALDIGFEGYTVVFGQVNYLKIKVNLAEGQTLYLDGVNVTAKVVDGIFKTDGIVPTNFDKKFNFEIRTDGVLFNAFSVSVNDYLSAKRESETMGKLVKALYNYGVSAKEYAIPSLDLSQYESGSVVDITEDVMILGDGNEYNVSLNIAENVTVTFDVGTGGVKLTAPITVADGKTLTLIIAGDTEHTVNGGISLGNASNVIIEGDLDKPNNKLTVTATDGNAGIGANNGVTAGDITIRNARVEATGSGSSDGSGAAIGTSNASMGNILIENSIVTAAGGYYNSDDFMEISHAAAIGMGYYGGTMGNITLKDSEITANNNGDGLASVIGAGSQNKEGDNNAGTLGDIIITNTDLNLSMVISNKNTYAAIIGPGIGYSYAWTNMGKIIFTDMTQEQLDAIIPTWLPSDFNEWGAYALGRGYDGCAYKKETFGGVWVSDGNGDTVQIGNESGYYCLNPAIQ